MESERHLTYGEHIADSYIFFIPFHLLVTFETMTNNNDGKFSAKLR